MKSKKLIVLAVMVLIAGGVSAKKAHAFCLFETDCPGGSATVSVEIDSTCKSDSDCPYGQQCNTATGACFTPTSATACACAPDGDACTDDSGVVTDTGGCFCPHTRLATPECSTTITAKPVGTLKPVNLEPLTPVPSTPDPVTPVTPSDPEPLPTPPLPPPAVETPGDDACAKLPLEYQACCRDVKGDPILVMKECVRDDSRASECDIVVNVMGSVGDKAQMNICCNVLNNSGAITDSKVTQECENTFGASETGSGSDASSSAGEATSAPGASKTSSSSEPGAPGSGGCSLIRE